MFEEALTVLQQPGAIAVIPTDTVYGVVARAVDEQAVDRLFTSVKPRDKKPGTIIAASIADLVGLGLKERYLKAVEQFWPGAVSVEIPSSDPKLQYLTRGLFTLAVRIPDAPELQKLLAQTGPLMTSSANLPDEPTSVTIAEAKAYFGDKVDLYVDGGDLSSREASTIIRIVDTEIEVLRQGAVKIEED